MVASNHPIFGKPTPPSWSRSALKLSARLVGQSPSFVRELSATAPLVHIEDDLDRVLFHLVPRFREPIILFHSLNPKDEYRRTLIQELSTGSLKTFDRWVVKAIVHLGQGHQSLHALWPVEEPKKEKPDA